MVILNRFHGKKRIIKYFWQFFFALLLLVGTTCLGKKNLQVGRDDAPVLTLAVKWNDKKKNISHKEHNLVMNEIDFRMQKDKRFDGVYNEIKQSSSSLYEFDFMDDKSEINHIVFQLLPFFNLVSQDNNDQLPKPTMITLFQINFF